jgi:Flp pilus assembly protein TadD
MGSVLINNKSYAEAIIHLRKAVSLDPNLGIAHHELGVVLESIGKHDEAASEFALATKLNAEQERKAAASAAIDRGDLALGKGDLAGAGTEFQNAVRLEPSWAKAHEGLAESLLSQGNTEEAIAEFRQALQLRPIYYEAEFHLGKALYKKQDLQEAVARFQNAVRLRPLSAEAYNDLGLALAAKGDYKEAVFAFRKALKIDPQFLVAQDNLNAILKHTHEVQNR